MNLRPLTGQVLVQVLPYDGQTAGGLTIPDIAKDGPCGEKKRARRGIIQAIGPWRRVKSGHAVLPEFQVGAQVIISEYIGTKLTRDIGENLRLLPVAHVLAVLTDTDSGRN